MQIYPNGARAISIAVKSLASSSVSDSSGDDPKAVPEFEPDRGTSLWPLCSYPGVSPLVTLTLSEKYVIDQRRR